MIFTPHKARRELRLARVNRSRAETRIFETAPDRHVLLVDQSSTAIALRDLKVSQFGDVESRRAGLVRQHPLQTGLGEVVEGGGAGKRGLDGLPAISEKGHRFGDCEIVDRGDVHGSHLILNQSRLLGSSEPNLAVSHDG